MSSPYDSHVDGDDIDQLDEGEKDFNNEGLQYSSYKFDSGDVYVGYFNKDGVFHGEGTITWSNGNRLLGSGITVKYRPRGLILFLPETFMLGI